MHENLQYLQGALQTTETDPKKIRGECHEWLRRNHPDTRRAGFGTTDDYNQLSAFIKAYCKWRDEGFPGLSVWSQFMTVEGWIGLLGDSGY